MGLVLAVLTVAMAADRAVPGAHVAVGLGLAACLVVIARADGLTAADLGLARSSWPSGLRWGAAAAALVGAAYALAPLIPAVRHAVPDDAGGLGRATLWAVLVVVPLGTVLPEELAFRGLLLPLLGRRHGVRVATLLSSALFGLWHVLPSLGGGPANAAIADAVGGDAPGWRPGSCSPCCSRRWPGSCSVGCGCAATAWSLPCWPIGRSTVWVSSWPWLPSCHVVRGVDGATGRAAGRAAPVPLHPSRSVGGATRARLGRGPGGSSPSRPRPRSSSPSPSGSGGRRSSATSWALPRPTLCSCRCCRWPRWPSSPGWSPCPGGCASSTAGPPRGCGGGWDGAPPTLSAGWPSSSDVEDRAELAVEDLERAGGFDRANLLVATTTGSGWLDAGAIDSFEYLTGGNSAVVAIQYSYLPSWLSYLVDQQKAREAGRQLFDAVYDRWSKLPPADRPRLFMFGLSLGSFGGETAFSGEYDLRNRTAGALFAGPPNLNTLYREFTDDRDPGSQEVEPVYRGGRTVRFTNDVVAGVGPASDPWNGTRVLYLQHPSDPIVWWSPRLAWDRPDWLGEPHGRDVLDAMVWIPLVTFWQVTVDLPMAAGVPAGHGHTYTREFADGWATILHPASWTPDRAEQLREIITAPE